MTLDDEGRLAGRRHPELAERKPNDGLLPAESLALTVALAQVLRGETPEPNVTCVVVYALARLTRRYDWTAGAADED